MLLSDFSIGANKQTNKMDKITTGYKHNHMIPTHLYIKEEEKKSHTNNAKHIIKSVLYQFKTSTQKNIYNSTH